jgi:hypothetical protein
VLHLAQLALGQRLIGLLLSPEISSWEQKSSEVF